jgi:CBS domain-containing protein
MLVRELMSKDPVTVTPATPVKAALTMLAEHAITSMPVLEHGQVCGVVSEADLIRDRVTTDRRAHELRVDSARPVRPDVVGEVMTRHAITAHPEDDLADVVELLTSTTIKSMPVVDHDGRLVGILSRSSIVRVLARKDQDLARDVDAALAWVGLGDWIADVSDGVVVLTGPDYSTDGAVAQLVAGTVPGVVEVTRG